MGDEGSEGIGSLLAETQRIVDPYPEKEQTPVPWMTLQSDGDRVCRCGQPSLSLLLDCRQRRNDARVRVGDTRGYQVRFCITGFQIFM